MSGSVTKVQGGAGRRDLRAIVFGVVAGLAGLLLLFLGSLHGLISPWYQSWVASESGIHHPEMHHWHDAQWGALGAILFAGSLFTLVRRPRSKPLLLQFLVIGALILVIADAPFSLAAVVLFLPVGLAFAVYPEHRALWDFSSGTPASRRMLALTGIAAVLLAPVTVRALHLQIVGWRNGDEHALALHWITGVALALALVVGGLLSATKRPGWQPLGVLIGIAYLYLGATALALPSQAGSWGAIGGILALGAGAAYIGVVALEARQPAARPGPQTGETPERLAPTRG